MKFLLGIFISSTLLWAEEPVSRRPAVLSHAEAEQDRQQLEEHGDRGGRAVKVPAVVQDAQMNHYRERADKLFDRLSTFLGEVRSGNRVLVATAIPGVVNMKWHLLRIKELTKPQLWDKTLIDQLELISVRMDNIELSIDFLESLGKTLLEKSNDPKSGIAPFLLTKKMLDESMLIRPDEKRAVADYLANGKGKVLFPMLSLNQIIQTDPSAGPIYMNAEMSAADQALKTHAGKPWTVNAVDQLKENMGGNLKDPKYVVSYQVSNAQTKASYSIEDRKLSIPFTGPPIVSDNANAETLVRELSARDQLSFPLMGTYGTTVKTQPGREPEVTAWRKSPPVDKETLDALREARPQHYQSYLDLLKQTFP